MKILVKNIYFTTWANIWRILSNDLPLTSNFISFVEYLTLIFEQLKCIPSEPLMFTSGLFLFLFLGFTIIYSLLQKTTNLRIFFVIAFSLYFYYKTSGMYFLLLVFVSLSDFTIGYFMSRAGYLLRKRLLLALSCTINIGLLCYFKYTNLFIEIINNFVSAPFDFANLFLPIGISFFTFQSMSYVIDIYRDRITPLRYYWDYLFYVSFFPQLVAGPIVRARDFIWQIRRTPITVSRSELGEAMFLITCGLFKKAVISDFISVNFVDRVFDEPMLYSGLENLMGTYGYAMQIYCDFSGYSDMAIGMALLLGFRFNANFDSPYKSATITEFWRRWHISLSSWLKDYLYISLGGNRKGKFRTYLNLIITMLLGGLWHGASLRFLLWGAIHGGSLAVHKWTMGRFSSFKAQGQDMKRWRRILGIFITFHLICFSWIFFRASDMSKAWDMLSQIFTNFHPEIFFDFVVGYKWVLIFLLLGYITHFVSDSFEKRVMQRYIALPLWVYPVVISVVIWLVMQLRTGELQSFIYFQF